MEQYMQFEEFVEYVKAEITGHLPLSMASGKVRIEPFRKIGSSYLSMRIDQKSAHGSPVVNLEEFYREYQHNKPVEELIDQMSELLTEEVPSFDSTVLETYESVKTRLFVRLCNRHWNKEFLKTVPHQDHSDFAVTVHILFSNTDQNWISTTFTNTMLEHYHIEKEKLFEDAFENAMRLFPAKIEDMKEMWKEEAGEAELVWETIQDRDVLTNQERINGAAVLFYPGMLKRLAMRYRSGFYLVPTSIHEFLVEKDREDVNIAQMELGLVKTNRAVTEQKEWLSEHIYHYDPFADVLERAADYQMRIRA